MKEEMTNPAAVFQPVVTKRASEVIYDQIRGMIVRQELKPGDRLPGERNMMEMFKRSRPTIREALRMLERNGYIRTIPGSAGSIVREPDETNMEQVMEDAMQGGHISLSEMAEYRAVCEVAAAGWAAERRTEEDLAAMRELLEVMKAAIDDGARFNSLDPAFHKLVAKAAKNQVAAMINKTLAHINEDFMREKMGSVSPSAWKQGCQRVHRQHLEIFQAIEAGDAAAAREAMTKHLASFREDLRPESDFGAPS